MATTPTMIPAEAVARDYPDIAFNDRIVDNACMQLVMQGKPAFCPRWSKARRALYREMFR